VQWSIRVGNSLLMRTKTRALYCVSLAAVRKGRYRGKWYCRFNCVGTELNFLGLALSQ